MPNFKPWQWITLIVLLLALNGVVMIGLVLALMTFVWTGPADLAAEAATPRPALRPTFTPTFTPEVWPTATLTRTPTRMPPATPTWTPLPTRTPEPTDTPTPYRPPTDTPTLTPTRTRVPTRTPLPTFTSTPEASSTPTSTPTSEPTPTWTPSPTSTASPSPGPTSTPPPSPTSTTVPPTQTPSPSATPTPSPQPTNTFTPIPSPSATPTPSPTSPPAAVALLPAPAGRPVKAASLTDASIGLTWQPVAGALTYRVYSDMGTGYGVYIFKTEADQPTLTDTDLRPGLRYTYRVGAVSRSGETLVGYAATVTGGRASAAIPAGPSSAEAPISASGQASGPLRVTPAPTPLPPDTIILGMLSATDYADDVDGTLTIVGEVRDDSALDVGETAVTATFYGADGQIIGEVSSPTLLQALAPGVRSPFIITLPRPTGVANYSLRATGRPVAPADTDGELVVVNTRRFEDTAGFYHIAGVIQNRGTQKVEQARVIVTLYDRAGRVINVGFGYPQPPALSPADRADFDVTFTYYPKVFSHTAIAVRD